MHYADTDGWFSALRSLRLDLVAHVVVAHLVDNLFISLVPELVFSLY